MKRILLIVSAMLLSAFPAYGQNSTVDSLIAEYRSIEKSKGQGAKALQLLMDIATAYEGVDYLKSIEYASLAIRKAKEVRDPETEAKAYNKRGWQYYMGGELSTAIDDYYSAMAIGKKHNLCRVVAASLNNIGVVYQTQGKLAEGFEVMKESLAERERCGDIKGMIRTYVNMGIILYKQGYYDIAMKYYKLAIEALDKEEDLITRASTEHNIANVYSSLKDHQNAIVHYRKAIAIYQNIGQKNREARTFGALGYSLRSNGDTLESSAAFLRAASMFFDEKSDAMNVFGYRYLGCYYENKNNVDSALFYFGLVWKRTVQNQDILGALNTQSQMTSLALRHSMPGLALAIADSMLVLMQQNSLTFTHEPFEIKAKAYVALGDYKNAFDAYTLFIRASDSIMAANRTERVAELEVQYKVQLTERENNLLKKQRDLDLAELARKTNALALLEKTRRLQGLELENRARLMEIQRRNSQRDDRKIQLLEKDRNIRTAQIERQQRLSQLWLAGVIALSLVTFLFIVLTRMRRKTELQFREKNDALEAAATEILLQQDKLREQNYALEDVNNEKNELLSIAAHDLKNPIGTVIGLSELLNNSNTPGMYKEECAHQIISTSRKMLKIVSDLLDIQKIESGITMVCKLPVDLDEPLSDALALNRSHADEKNISVLVQSDGNDHTALADAAVMTQVFDNLVSNAVKFSPPGKMVLIHLKTVPGYVRFEVHDQGPGLSARETDMLFQKFAKLSAKPTAGEISTGLGLYIVKRMMDALNGTIWCESAVGSGSTFIVEIPAVSRVSIPVAEAV